MLRFLSVLLVIFFVSFPAYGQDFSDPCRVLYREIDLGMEHTEVNALLQKHSLGKNKWEIHEQDLRGRTDRWSVII